MKLMQLRYFSAVCHLGGVTRAAERLHVSQPAITAAIQNLEDELGLLLLSRGGRTLVPTLDGEAFLARCDGILTEVEGLTADFQARSQRRSTLSVGVPPMVAFFLFPKIFAEFTGSCPEVHIRLTEAGSDTARDMVDSCRLSLAAISFMFKGFSCPCCKKKSCWTTAMTSMMRSMVELRFSILLSRASACFCCWLRYFAVSASASFTGACKRSP